MAQTQAPGDLGVKYVSKTVINIGLVVQPLDSGPRLVQVWLGDLAVRESSVCFRVKFVLFIGLGRAYRLAEIFNLSYGGGGWSNQKVM